MSRGGILSMKAALKLCRKAGCEVVDKPKSSLVKITYGEDSITVSKLEKDVTRGMQAWLRKHGIGEES